MRILITGGRDWDDEEAIRHVLESIVAKAYSCLSVKKMVVIHGGAAGADTIAGKIAKELGMQEEVYPVTQEEWDTIGPPAGPLRNQRMLDKGKPDVAHAFIMGKSVGTLDMIERIMGAGVLLTVHPYKRKS